VSAAPAVRAVSVVIPARNEATLIGDVVGAVLAQGRPDVDLEVLVVDDGSHDGTATVAAAAGARVVSAPARSNGGNPAAARNHGAALASGDPIVFLDADCRPTSRWLDALLRAHDAGATIVGGSLAAPTGGSWSARCDYYAGCYHVHPRRPAGPVPNHPPANLSVRRAAFLATSQFTERHPVADGHEELAWQAELAARGHRIHFAPAAVAEHRNRPGVSNLLRRSYRWGFSALEAKALSATSRAAWWYRRPALALGAALPLAVAESAYIVVCWVRARVLAPVALFPLLLTARLAYAAGFIVGGLRWLARRGPVEERPRWR